jgi:hypothetical protein
MLAAVGSLWLAGCATAPPPVAPPVPPPVVLAPAPAPVCPSCDDAKAEVARLRQELANREAELRDLRSQQREQVRALQESTKQAARAKTKLRRLATQADTASYMAEVEVGLETARAATPAASPPPLLDLAQDILDASALPYAQAEYGTAVELATQAEQLIQIVTREPPGAGTNGRRGSEVALETPLPLRLKAGASLRREPRDKAPAVASLAEGALVTAFAWRENWFRVETEDGASGWIAETLATRREK